MMTSRTQSVRYLISVVLFLVLSAPASAQGRHDQYGWGHRRHWEHRQPPPQQGIDFGAIIGGIAGAAVPVLQPGDWDLLWL